MRTFAVLAALAWSAALVFLACGGTSSSGAEGNLPLPDRHDDGDAEAGSADVIVSPPDDDAGVVVPDAAVDAGLGCNGALDCERVVFVTKGSFVGSAIGGLAGGDAICQAAADAATGKRIKGRTFRAWLSTTTTAASTRIPHGTKPFILNNGAVVAKDWNDLIDGSLGSGIDRDENNTLVPGGSAWTGTITLGAASATTTCGSWDAANLNGTRGNVGGAGGGWSSAGISVCTAQLHLYCFEL